MGDFANGFLMKIFVTLLAIVIIGINIFFVIDFVATTLPQTWWVFTIVGIFGVLYFLFIAYLTIALLVHMGIEGLLKFDWIRKYYWFEPIVDAGPKKKPAPME